MALSRPCFAILSDQTFHVLAVRHMIRKRIPSSMTKYNFIAVRRHVDVQQLLRIARDAMSHKSSVAHQCTALLTLPDCNLWRQTPLIKAVSILHIRSLTVRRTGKVLKFVDCASNSRNLEISSRVLCNLEIA